MLKWLVPAVLLLACGWLAVSPRADATAVSPGAAAPAQWLRQADEIHSVDHARFVRLVRQLRQASSRLTPAQRWHLALLEAEQWVDAADYPRATPQLQAIIDHSGDRALSIRALSELVQVEFLSHHDERAYAAADQMMTALPRVADPLARMFVLNQVVQMLDDVGQYDLAPQYARQLRDEFPLGKGQCLGSLGEMQAEAYAGRPASDNPRYQRAIDICLAVGQVISANALRLDQAAAGGGRPSGSRHRAVAKDHAERPCLGLQVPGGVVVGDACPGLCRTRRRCAGPPVRAAGAGAAGAGRQQLDRAGRQRGALPGGETRGPASRRAGVLREVRRAGQGGDG